ncbi:MAG: hypothetical protein H5T86_09200 [Armatimonadetes bacterium]|nr:hypothetical protein [Armatimonadota bacterium]
MIDIAMRAALIARALAVTALAVAVGHLSAVTAYQRQRLDEARPGMADAALHEHLRYQGVVERRTLAVAQCVILLCSAAVAARTAVEALLLLLTAISAAGATAAAEMLALGFDRILWPLVPAEFPAPPWAVIACHGAGIVAVCIVYISALRATIEPAKPPSRVRHQPAVRRRPPE